MDDELRKDIESLLSSLSLSQLQASVLVDETCRPVRFRLFITDEQASRHCPKISNWRGHPVDVICNAKFEPSQRFFRDVRGT